MTLSMSYLITVNPGAIFNELLSWLAYLNRGDRSSPTLFGWHCDGRRTTWHASAPRRAQAGSRIHARADRPPAAFNQFRSFSFSGLAMGITTLFRTALAGLDVIHTLKNLNFKHQQKVSS